MCVAGAHWRVREVPAGAELPAGRWCSIGRLRGFGDAGQAQGGLVGALVVQVGVRVRPPGLAYGWWLALDPCCDCRHGVFAIVPPALPPSCAGPQKHHGQGRAGRQAIRQQLGNHGEWPCSRHGPRTRRPAPVASCRLAGFASGSGGLAGRDDGSDCGQIQGDSNAVVVVGFVLAHAIPSVLARPLSVPGSTAMGVAVAARNWRAAATADARGWAV